MRKILLYSLLLFWWCLMFPSNSYTANIVNENSNLNSFNINDKEIRFRIMDFVWDFK